MNRFERLLKKDVVFLDGATGTILYEKGLTSAEPPELWCIKNPRVLSSIHASYVSAGADIVYTSTFGANRIKLASRRSLDIRSLNTALAGIARKAVGKNTLLAGDIGPTGKFIEPFGQLAFDEAVGVFKEQARGLLAGGVDMFVVETMMDIQEARAALIAVKELCDIPVIVSMTFDKSGRTLNGTSPSAALVTLQALGAAAVGCNCSCGPKAILPFIEEMLPFARVPLLAKPNAGIPQLYNGKAVFSMAPSEFARHGKRLVSAGARLVGGCCGTTPVHIKALSSVLGRSRHNKIISPVPASLSSVRRVVAVRKDGPTLFIGECINPTRKKKLREQLSKGKTAALRILAKEQEHAGADLLDVNVGLTAGNEKKTLTGVVLYLSKISPLPLVIDSSDPLAIERALRLYPGRALLNSITAKKKQLKRLLAVAKKYGSMFILLPLDGKQIPRSLSERKRIVTKIVKEALAVGFTKADIVVDAMALTISSNAASARQSLEAVSWCNKFLNCSTVVGLSNISFGLPERNWINAAFLSQLMVGGLSMVIANPSQQGIMKIKRAADALLMKDPGARRYCDFFSPESAREKKSASVSSEQELFDAIIAGDSQGIRRRIDTVLREGVLPSELVDKCLIPAITHAGELFDKHTFFLPQLIGSAQVVKKAFAYLEPLLKKEGRKPASKRTVVLLATVKGDIHDIGKNIIRLLLENHGVTVIDLGKDVSAARIIREIKRHPSPIVGLSALMTTTMIQMKEVIRLAKKEKLDCRFIVGGAVVTSSYARSIGAEYAPDGVNAVKLVKRISK